MMTNTTNPTGLSAPRPARVDADSRAAFRCAQGDEDASGSDDGERVPAPNNRPGRDPATTVKPGAPGENPGAPEPARDEPWEPDES